MFLKKLKTEPSHAPAISFLSINPKGIVTVLKRDLSSHVLSSTIHKIQVLKRPECLLADGAVKECDVDGEADTPRDGEERDSFNKKACMGNPKQG